MPKWLKSINREIFSITYHLFKLMIPIIIIVKIIGELGGIKYFAYALEPLMEMVGLPASMGLVWATTMITNIYGGMIIFITTATNEALTVAQVTVLGSMMMIAHSLPIEVRIVQKVGVRVIYTLILRIGGALLLGYILHKIYSNTGYLTETNDALWKPTIDSDDSLLSWIKTQLITLFQVFLVIAVLVIFLRLLKLSGIERLLIFLLKPLLKVLGLSDTTTSISIIGITLGLTYGGSLLINEAQTGKVSKMDVFGSLSLLSLCHALIEDTLLVMLIGADISGVLYARLVFSLLLIAIIVRLVRRIESKRFQQFFVYPKQHSP